MIIRQSEIWPRVSEWVTSQGLDVRFSLQYPTHDMLHVFYDLGIDKEGIVLIIEECIKDGVLCTEQDFIELAMYMKLNDTDNYNESDCLTIYNMLKEQWPVTVELDLA